MREVNTSLFLHYKFSKQMLEQKFLEISEELNCNYKIVNKEIDDYFLGRKLSVNDYYLEIEHQNSVIFLCYELANQSMAKVTVEVELNHFKENFEISTRSHFQRLFVKNKSPWKINCPNAEFKKKLLTILDKNELSDFAQKTSFEPIIYGKRAFNKIKIETKFSLAFENKENSIIPVINYHKRMIEFLSE
ncbi:hypothetical protein [Aureivirga sp. CE67]|uniref:hypothetical protein n=1 Tax=Aureivirga sp. CE67 TaxID=1788983 RepID=UPI0018CB4882|nr:hypothetical protein [Aureivirga sp. CE67]